ncbi:MAG: PEP-CTERM sorting domain-containing protein [Planctomycetota bacterium]|jgi:hypothetical protein
MMKKNSLLVMILLAAISVANATLTDLPDSNMDVDGISYFNDNGISGRIEFAVYDMSISTFDAYDRDEQFIYAYQLFTEDISSVNAIAIFGFDPLAVQADDALDVSDELYADVTSGRDAGAELVNEGSDDVKALYSFDSGAAIVGDNSLFLLIFSDFGPVTGSYDINPTNNDIQVPGENLDGSNNEGVHAPEPATLALLLGGGLLSLRRRRTS